MKFSHYSALEKHYAKYFEVIDPDKEITVLHPLADDGWHVDVAIYHANKNRPFQILATMGASDFAMPGRYGELTNRNEYITFAPADWDFDDERYRWLADWLFTVAHYPRLSGEGVTYAHTLDMTQVRDEQPGEDFNMTAVQIMFPQVFDTGVLRARLGLLRTATILHMMPITGAELHEVREGGNLEAVIDRVYSDEPGNMNFLSARFR